MSVILPVEHFCLRCGWAYEGDNTLVLDDCRRCGKLEKAALLISQPSEKFRALTVEPITVNSALPKVWSSPPPLSSPSPEVYPREYGMSLPPQQSAIAIEEFGQKDIRQTVIPSLQNVCKPFKKYKSIKNINRRSRAYSRQFVASVNFPGPPEVSARPLVKNIVDLASKCWKSKDSYEEMGILLVKEQQKGTAWKEIADETIMELIINEVQVFYFAQALIRTFKISKCDFGNFIATPPDQGTMSLIEEALCHDSMPLFVELLKQERDILSGVLESKDVPAEAQEKIILLLSQLKSGN